MEVNLIPPIMMRLAGIIVDECPKCLSQNPSIETHSAYFAEYDIRAPFLLEGTISYIPTWRPTKDELRVHEGQYLSITPNSSEWSPRSSIYSQQ